MSVFFNLLKLFSHSSRCFSNSCFIHGNQLPSPLPSVAVCHDMDEAVKDADVVMENMRPGVLDRLGLVRCLVDLDDRQPARFERATNDQPILRIGADYQESNGTGHSPL